MNGIRFQDTGAKDSAQAFTTASRSLSGSWLRACGSTELAEAAAW